MFNCCCNPTSDFNIRRRSSAKNNSHTCKFARANASHSLLYNLKTKTDSSLSIQITPSSSLQL
jgi:hypothetical protein